MSTEWQQINPELIKLFNSHLNYAIAQIKANGFVYPTLGVIEDGEIQTYTNKQFPKMEDVFHKASGIKTTTVCAVVIVHEQNSDEIRDGIKTDKIKRAIEFNLEHKCGDCVTIMVPYSLGGFLSKKLKVAESKDFIVETCNKFVWVD